jgi:bacterioferritin
MELRAVHQYMNQHYNLDNWDYGELAANVKLIAIDAMPHAERFADRIEESGGEPTAEPADATEKGQKADVAFAFDAAVEDNTIASYNEFLSVCRENGDSISVMTFAKKQVTDSEGCLPRDAKPSG